jgi:peptidoglycan/LPS O-acetylase OafA/YrhL
VPPEPHPAPELSGEEALTIRATVPSVAPVRIVGLDGIRGLAALYVVLYHIFLRAWPGAAAAGAPFWAAWLDKGRTAVIIFIALSGFSLALGPVRSGWRFPSIMEYARRRAWRILPPYWAALGFSLVMVWFVLAQPGWAVPDGKSVVVYGLLLQDIFSTGIPNRAFWSIAIEAQLYILLPLLLLIVRRFSALAMVAVVAFIVATMGLLGPHVAWANDALVQYTPDLAVLFAVGVLAAGIVTASDRARALPWGWFALAAAVPVIVLISINGETWSNANLFWTDLASAPAIGCLLAAIATSGPSILVRFLNTRPLRSLGSFSYSLYLTHLPIVIAVAYGLVLPRVPTGTPTFVVLVAILVPTTILFARLFAAFFEIPFQRRRGWGALCHGQRSLVQTRTKRE